MVQTTFFAPDSVPLIAPGQPLAPVIVESFSDAGIDLADNDILVVAQKIVSKSENRYRRLASITPGEEARDFAARCQKDPRFIQAVLDETERVIRCSPGVFIVRHRRGYCLANAGIDQSNIDPVDDDVVLLLPEDPDASARQLRSEIRQLAGADVGIVISDSFGRPWRLGTTGVCIGCAGVLPIHDQRGQKDLYGRTLQVTQPAIGDEIAAAASLVMGEANEGRPLALLRGLSVIPGNPPATDLIRASNEDLFR